jgi:hypothetical protein
MNTGQETRKEGREQEWMAENKDTSQRTVVKGKEHELSMGTIIEDREQEKRGRA